MKRGLLILFISFFLIPVVYAEVYCSYQGPDLSNEFLRLTDFIVEGPLNIEEGESITVKFNLQNYGQFDIEFADKGVFAAAEDPDSDDASFGFTSKSTTIKPGEFVYFESTKKLNMPGKWKIWPSYHIYSGNDKKYGPDEWHVCKITVEGIEKDSDKDGINDDEDNCPDVYNPDQKNGDGDSFGDVCDDSDQDGVYDSTDNCIFIPNPNQEDANDNGIGDACDQIVDSDGDDVADEKDNCPQKYNPQQEDVDKDGLGDVCDSCDDRDSDQDGVINCIDKCPKEKETLNKYQDEDGCPDELPEPVVKTEEKPTLIEDKGEKKEESGFNRIIVSVKSIFNFIFKPIMRFFSSAGLKTMPAPDFYIVKINEQTKTGNYIGEINPAFDPNFNTTVILQINNPSGFAEFTTDMPAKASNLFEVKGTYWEDEVKLDVVNYTKNYFYEKAFRNYRKSIFFRKEAQHLADEINAKLDTLAPGRSLCKPSDALAYMSTMGASIPLTRSGITPSTPEEVEREVANEFRYYINDTVYGADGLYGFAAKVRSATNCPEEVETWLIDHPSVMDRVERYSISELEISSTAIYGSMGETGYTVIFSEGSKERIQRALRSMSSSIAYIKSVLETIFSPEDSRGGYLSDYISDSEDNTTLAVISYEMLIEMD